MGGGHEETPRGWRADTGREGHKATAAGTDKLAQAKGHAKRVGLYHIEPEGVEPFSIEAKGRDAWALERLCAAGSNGCTPITEPAPRWSAYVHNLRALKVPIETLQEPHGGEFSGTHARYVLRATVTPMTEGGTPDGETI